MRKIGFALTALLLVAAIVWAGGDPWKTKPFDQWTEKDVLDVLQNSPWSKANIQAQGAWHPDGTTQMSGSVGIAGSGSDTSNRSEGATPDQLGGAQKNASAAAAQAVYTIFWWSSRTIRAASTRRAVLKGTMTQADADKAVATPPDDYMILIQGTNMVIFQQRGEQAFQNAAYIQLKKNKEKLSPSKVVFLKGPDGTVTSAIFYFSKKGSNGEPTISADEKGIDFYLQIGGSKILTNFDPKKMVDNQGEDL